MLCESAGAFFSALQLSFQTASRIFWICGRASSNFWHLAWRLIRIFWGLPSRRTSVWVSPSSRIFCACYFCFVRLFFANSFNVPKGSSFIFLYFVKEWMLEIFQSAPLLQFSALWDFSNRIIFVLKLGFLRPSPLYQILVFLKTAVFSMRLF